MKDIINVPVRPRRIRAICLPRGERSVVVRRIFGPYRFCVEAMVGEALVQICPGHVPGGLQCYALENGSLYFAPTGQPRYQLDMGHRRFRGEASANITGIVASMVAFSHLSCETEVPVFEAVRYHLRQFVLAHPDRQEIERVLA
jgi:hypothetical protein